MLLHVFMETEIHFVQDSLVLKVQLLLAII